MWAVVAAASLGAEALHCRARAPRHALRSARRAVGTAKSTAADLVPDAIAPDAANAADAPDALADPSSPLPLSLDKPFKLAPKGETPDIASDFGDPLRVNNSRVSTAQKRGELGETRGHARRLCAGNVVFQVQHDAAEASATRHMAQCGVWERTVRQSVRDSRGSERTTPTGTISKTHVARVGASLVFSVICFVGPVQVVRRALPAC